MANRKTTVRVTQPEETKQPSDVSVPNIETQVIPVHVIGISPLIVNNFDEKTITELDDKSQGKVTKRGQGRPPKVPEDEFQKRRILNDKGQDCIFGRWVKAALVTACTLTEDMLKRPLVRQTVWVREELIVIEGPKPEMSRDVVRVGKWPNKQPDIRYRPKYNKWALSFHIEYEPRLVPLARLVYLIRRAGLSVGLCEWRPEKGADGGMYGRFDLKLMGAS